jgi:XTP/dITP diphosphohydrolase
VADGEQESFGEMDPARKHAISHRAKAFALFAKACLGATR